MKMTIKSGDNVLVIAGKDKGKTGKVTAVYADQNKVLVENVNIVSKHVKPRKMGEAGGIIKAESALYADKVQLICPKCSQPTRVGHLIDGDKKVRVCKKCGEVIDK